MALSKEILSSKTILIVDDQTNNLKLVSRYLENANYNILIAQSGKKALDIADALSLDLILLDVMMPRIDGFEVCRHLKSNSKTKDIPIIFMTALAETKDRVQGFKLGAVDYISKPVESEELMARVQTHLSLYNLHQSSLKDAAQRKLLFEISDRIRQSLDLKVILETSTKEIRTLLDCDFVGLASLNQKNIAIKAFASREARSINPQKLIDYSYYCPTEDVYNSYLKGHIEVIEPENSQNHPEAIPSGAPLARLIVPILIKDTNYTSGFFSSAEDTMFTSNILYGWLIADRYSPRHPWQLEEINLLRELTTQLAIGIKQGLLHKQLSELALLDSLTRVYNRRSFDRQLKREWGRLKRVPAPLSLIMCDVDCFKIYNDIYGHQQGDRCLQQVAKAISSALRRPGDLLARYGGEEFVVILPQTPQSGAVKVAETIRNAVKSLKIPHHNSLVDSVVTVSLGVASTIPNTVDNPQLLIEAADLALYQSKDRGRDCVAVYPEPISHSKDRQELKIRWVKRLRDALDHNLFSLYAQSIIPLKGNDERKSFEILLRLTDKADRVILPGVFLDIAERNFLMTDIDTWVVNNLLETLEKCARHIWNNNRFAVNLSGSSLNNESFLQFLKRRLTECSLPPELFCFEITESVAVSDLSRIVEFINSLKEIGCSFALDDFGKGVSSLTYLKSLPVDYLKIDGSFIKELNVNPTSKVMVEAINHIAEGTGLKTVAEFVENEDILSSVRDLNVDYAQGFHLSRPSVLMDAISAKDVLDKNIPSTKL
ncbi:MAG: EAL domain-containing protein [Pleurocapsa sp. MO_226.B13]|nr:EAL domain-containing protein [Pleurocapsa sp. MO_226.B13]